MPVAGRCRTSDSEPGDRSDTDSATIYGGYVGDEIQPIEIQNLWGIYNIRE